MEKRERERKRCEGERGRERETELGSWSLFRQCVNASNARPKLHCPIRRTRHPLFLVLINVLTYHLETMIGIYRIRQSRCIIILRSFRGICNMD